MKKVLSIFLFFSFAIQLWSQSNVSKLEYFYDVEPGFGNGTDIPITPATSLDVNFVADLTGLTNGIHFLYLRAMNDSGWSNTLARPFIYDGTPSSLTSQPNITQLESFIGVDPGFGNGDQIAVSPNGILDINSNINLSSVSPGLHILHLRAKNEFEVWGGTFTKPILVVGNGAISNLTKVEYFFDSDPGFGGGTNVPITSSNFLDLNFNADLNGLSNGIHVLYVRSLNAEGWSITYSRPFIYDGSPSSLVSNPNITQIESFLDTDPGFGNGTQLTFTPNSVVDLSSAIDLSSASQGLHMLHMRAKNEFGVWGNTFTKPILVVGNNSNPNLSEIEYFFDNDPGFGNGTAIPTSATSVVSTSLNLDLSSLSTGMHTLYIRSKDENGDYSLTYKKPFLKTGNVGTPEISYVEFHIDSFAGYGLGTSVSINNSSIIDTNLVVPLPGSIANGNHEVYIATKDNNGSWSLITHRMFCVGPQANFTADTVCYGIPTSFTDLSANIDSMSTTFFWDFDNDGILEDSTLGNKTHLYDSAGTYTAVLILDKDSVCADTMTFNVTVLPNSLVSSFLSDTVCFGSSSTLVNTSSGGSSATTYEWDVDDNGTIDFTNTGGFQTVLSGNAGYHVVKLTSYDTPECPSVFVDSVFVDSTSVDAVFSADSACAGTITTFFDASLNVNSSTTYAWDIDNDSVTEYTTNGNITHMFPSAGSYTTKLILNSHLLCPDTFSTSVIVLPNSLSASYTSDTVCFGQNSEIFNTTTGGSSTTNYEWDIDNDGTIDFTSSSGFQNTFQNKAGFHVVRLTTYDIIECPSSYLDSVYVDSTSVNAKFSTDSVCIGSATTFFDQSTGVNSSTTYMWDVNNDNNVNYTTPGSIAHVFPSVGLYNATLILNNHLLCPDTFGSTVVVDSLGSISGNVFNTSGPINDGHVKLYTVADSGVYELFDSVRVDLNGNYEFTDVAPNQYVLRGNPNSLVYPNTVATYYDSTYTWSNATILNTHCDTTIDLALLDISQVFGDGTINGFVFLTDTLGNRAGEPIPGIGISLQQKPGGIIGGYTETDNNGFYEFTNLPDHTYDIRVDIPGAPMDSTYTVTITAQDTLHENLDFVFDSTNIYVDETVSTLLSGSMKSANFSIKAYPNPFKNDLNVSLESQVSVDEVEIGVYNLVGTNIAIVQKTDLESRNYIFPLGSLSEIPAGIYFISTKINGLNLTPIKVIKLN